ncbi:MAG: hypothetical protein A2498_08355 [Lentisphaerae bacterium RIFOXYC12_FULL_60_16]|nr:MAG: hypothetical protein A2498_08355 [Lentisphaerae bacterium RIFOXYC12_FULL_60_16]
MKNIVKGNEPPSLTQHRQQAHADYDNYVEKDDLRASLLSEQGHLCCYCMQRIRWVEGDRRMKIAHWHSQTWYPGEQLVYRNLLGACPGSEGRPLDQQHCDSRQGDRDIMFNPAEPAHNVESRIRYLGDGTIEADHVAFDRELNEVLNLNHPRIKANRRAVVDSVIAEFGRDPGSRTRGQIQALIHAWTSLADGEYREFCCVAIYFLTKRLNRAN